MNPNTPVDISHHRLPLFFRVCYDGSAFHGWQRQRNSHTICNAVESAFRTVFRDREIVVRGASRTDTGVHAVGQAAVAMIEPDIYEKLQGDAGASIIRRYAYSLNSLLRPFIQVFEFALAPKDFQVRYDSIGKLYFYNLLLDKMPGPFDRYAWPVKQPFTDTELTGIFSVFEGEHDFAAFARSSGKNGRDTRRTIHKIHAVRHNKTVSIFFHGSSFLHHQIRIMVGSVVSLAKTGVETGNDLVPYVSSRLNEILQSGNRNMACIKAPAYALFLHKVYYPDNILERFTFLTGSCQ